MRKTIISICLLSLCACGNRSGNDDTGKPQFSVGSAYVGLKARLQPCGRGENLYKELIINKLDKKK
ncbi:hypothetical protein AGMMS49982_23700 [Bacteroidia bacterium]|nr:hypothetical protein AGMMS49982_23700 [Bacteroidia bacterium]